MDFINGLDEYNEDVIKISESPYEYNDTDDKDDCKCEKCYDHDNYCENGKCSCKDCKDECCEECEDDDERIEGFEQAISGHRRSDSRRPLKSRNLHIIRTAHKAVFYCH